MIKYNFCYRGAFEYDKSILNVMQLYNEVAAAKNKVMTSGAAGAEMLEAKTKFDAAFDEITGDSNNEQLLALSLLWQ